MGTSKSSVAVLVDVKFVFPLALLALSASAIADSIDDYVKSEMKRLDIPEVTIGIVKDGRLVRSQAYGFSDPKAKVAGRIDDVFEVGSITKQFTALGTLMLVESGRVDLEDSIAKFLPDIPDSWANVKVRNLLNQNSGLPEYALVNGIGLLDTFDRKKFMETISKQPVDFQPGEAWAYSNTNYALLGWIIEKVTGEPYIKFMKENVLNPLGMTHSSFAEHGVDVPGLPKGFIKQGRRTVPCPRGGASIKADGALMTTLADMVKWDAALSDRRLLSRKSYQLLWSPGRLNNGRTRSYGMGWFLNMPGTGEYEGHGGNDAGYSAGISRFPGKHLSVFMFCNLYPVGGEVMTKAIAELYDPSLKMRPLKETTDPNPARTERVKLAIGCMATGKADDTILEPEMSAPLKTSRVVKLGVGPWAQIAKIDRIAFAGARAQGSDTWLTYSVTAQNKKYILMVLWSNQNKLAQGSVYPAPEK